ncbi:nuclear transport factor 2 family protein [Sphingobium sp. BHU LFT2]|uniref:nuclear transport factor 2 family protein n=1 Tax=Sphingobium sp. BHU LFT2 TaxID=2807634 RepID=UPI001BECB59B|nr:nuclear transport factor 2 family protein [Sphingobium sp. BHU LFT2]MBT2246064.1 nuclear transport factor 2 family protein [Sphingobium sp. BHU LFT2]
MSASPPPEITPIEQDYDHLLRSNLERVFNEREPTRRAQAIAELFVEQPILYEPDGVVHGRKAISAVAGELLKRFGPNFAFVSEKAAIGHHGMGSLRWHAGPPEGSPIFTGIDTAAIVDGRIEQLWVLLDASK